MRTLLALVLILPLAALPDRGAAQSQVEDRETGPDAPSAIEEGLRDLFEGMIDDMRPGVEELSALVEEYRPLITLLGEEMAPALAEVLGQIDSISNYTAPEILPNGDIVMRRRPDAPPYVAPPPAEPGEPGANPDSDSPEPDGDGTIDL